MSFLLQSQTGKTPPKYLHKSLESAITEAKRLSVLLKEDIKILELVGVVSQKEVPVTKIETKVELVKRLEEEMDDLPF